VPAVAVVAVSLTAVRIACALGGAADGDPG
jgi:hypothetical protein